MENIGQVHSAVASSATTGHGKAKAGSLFATLMAAVGKSLKIGVDGKTIKGAGKFGQVAQLTKEAHLGRAIKHGKKLAAESLLSGKHVKKDAHAAGRKHGKDDVLGALGIVAIKQQTLGEVAKGKIDKSHSAEEHLKILKSALQQKSNRADHPDVRKSLAEMIHEIERKNSSNKAPLSDNKTGKQLDTSGNTFSSSSKQAIAAHEKAQHEIQTGIGKNKQASLAATKSVDGQKEAKVIADGEANTRYIATEKATNIVHMPRSASSQAPEASLQDIMATAAKAEKKIARVQQSISQQANKEKKFALLKTQSAKVVSSPKPLTAQPATPAQMQPQQDAKIIQLHTTPLPASSTPVDLSMLDDAGTATPQASNGNMPASVQGMNASSSSVRGVYTASVPMHAATPNTGPWTAMQAMQEIGAQAGQGKTRLQLQLEPAHLGKIQVFLESDSQKKIQIHMVVDQNHSRQLLEQHLPMLRQALDQQGLNLGNFSMGGEQHHGTDNRRQQEASDGSPMQHDAAIEMPNIQSAIARISPSIDGRLSIHI